MEKKWKTNGNKSIDLLVQGRPRATLNLSSDTITLPDGTVYRLKRKGIFRSRLIVTDAANKELTRIKPVRWYGTSYNFSWKGQGYVLSVGNNPLAEWRISSGKKLILSYGLDASAGKIQLKTGGTIDGDPFFDCLLYYLIRPAYHEQSGTDETTLLLLLTAAG
ncbi:hypothetical protein FLLO111716_13700 [Flavobacterium longum]|uniref:hypothetical protein n=1 Tax=Flavobacterium longum TaxID=1299340 RepID=UPI0039EB5174